MSDLEHVKGLGKLQTFIKRLPGEMQDKVVRGGLRAGAKPIRAEAERLVHVRSGKLKATIRVTTTIIDGKVTAIIRAGSHEAFWPIWLEYGTKPHLIKVSDRQRPDRVTRRGVRKVSMRMVNRMVDSGSLVINNKFVGESVDHPGATPHPFMRPALDNKHREAIAAFADYVKKRLARGRNGFKDIRDVEVEV